MAADHATLSKAKSILSKRIKMMDLRKVKWFLGMNIIDKAKGVYLTQT